MEVMKNRTRTGFTLIELLVVVSIIGLLVSLLLPALSQSRDAAKSALCMARMRDFSLRIEDYRNDYNTWYPVNYVGSWPVTGGFSTKFVDQMLPYMNGFGNTDWRNRANKNHFLCPSDYYQPVGTGSSGNAAEIRKTAYISDGWRVTNYMMSGVFGYGTFTTQPAQYRPRREIRTVSPSIAVMMGEIYSVSPVFGYLQGSGSTTIFPHQNNTNILFAAGNVKAFRAQNNTNQALYLNNGAANGMQVWFQ
jgi:prepilin-type N-terminal cleavage/methylation domain-containing protein